MNNQAPISDFARRMLRDIAQPGAGQPSQEVPWTETGFNDRALELFRIQFEAVDPLRRVALMRQATPDSIRDWRQIPDLPAAAFKDFEVSSIPEGLRVATFLSSGTTRSQRSRHFHSAESLALYEASLTAWFVRCALGGAAGLRRWQIVALTPNGTSAPQSSLAHMASVVVRDCGSAGSCCIGTMDQDGGWQTSLSDLREACARGGDAPVLLFGTAFSFVHLLDQLAASGGGGGGWAGLPAGSLVMETGGYKGRSREMPKPELHRAISRGLGVAPSAIITEYGMSELSSQAYQRSVGEPGSRTPANGFRFPPWARAIVVSPETGIEVPVGGTGLLRVVDLANVGSVLAIGTGDLAVRREDGFELIGRPNHAEPRGCSLMAA